MPAAHDQLFKDLIRHFPADFLRLIAPTLARRVEATSLEPQPTELFLDLPRGRRRQPDLLLRALARGGEAGAILLHLEIEQRFRSHFPSRLWRYNRLLHLRFDLPLHSFVLYLRGGPPGIHHGRYREEALGEEVACFRFRSWSLASTEARTFLAKPQPIAWALAALMRTPHGYRHRARLRLACLRRIAAARQLNEAERFLLFNCVATYLQLEGRAEQEYQALLDRSANREVREMTMTWAEKMQAEGFTAGLREGRQEGRQEGRREGLLEGRRELLLDLLQRRFQRVPAELARRIGAINSPQRLTRLAERVYEVESLDQLSID